MSWHRMDIRYLNDGRSFLFVVRKPTTADGQNNKRHLNVTFKTAISVSILENRMMTYRMGRIRIKADRKKHGTARPANNVHRRAIRVARRS